MFDNSAARARKYREARKDNLEFHERERARVRQWRTLHPDTPEAVANTWAEWRADNQDWVDSYKLERNTSRYKPFVAIDSEGQNFPASDLPQETITYDGAEYPPHGTYLWGASPIDASKATYLLDPRTQGVVKYRLSVTQIFNWLLDVVAPRYGKANFVMFGMSYDVSQMLLQLPRETSFEIFKSKRFEDDEEVRAPAFWRDYAIKLVKGKWVILWKLRNREYPYKVNQNGELLRDKKGRVILDAIQRIQIYETYTYFQTGFAKVVDDMLLEEKAAIARRLIELKARQEHVNSSEYERQLREELANDEDIGAAILADRHYEDIVISEERAELAANARELGKDTTTIIRMKKLRGQFDTVDIESLREYMTAEIRLLAKRMEQVRFALAELGLHPTSWHGPGAVATALIMKYKIREHFGNDTVSGELSQQQEFARGSFSGGHIELMKQGYEKSRYLGSYDLSSAYPAGAVELPSLAPYAGEWVHKTTEDYSFNSLAELREKVEAASMVSMFQIRFLLPSFSKLAKGEAARLNPKSEFIPFFPLWFRKQSGGIPYPSSGLGRYNLEDALAAIAWMERYMPNYPANTYSERTGSIERSGENTPALFVIEEAWIWRIAKGWENTRPFAVLKELYAKRRAIKDEIERRNVEIEKQNKEIETRNKALAMDGAIDFKPFELLPLEYNILEKVIKLVLNSVYGKLAQYVGSEGKVPKCANPYYAAAITAYCRRRLMEAMLISPASIVFAATDGIVSTTALHILPDPKCHRENSET